MPSGRSSRQCELGVPGRVGQCGLPDQCAVGSPRPGERRSDLGTGEGFQAHGGRLRRPRPAHHFYLGVRGPRQTRTRVRGRRDALCAKRPPEAETTEAEAEEEPGGDRQTGRRPRELRQKLPRHGRVLAKRPYQAAQVRGSHGGGRPSHAVKAVSPDWNEQAAKSAETKPLDTAAFSKKGLIKQLKFGGLHAGAGRDGGEDGQSLREMSRLPKLSDGTSTEAEYRIMFCHAARVRGATRGRRRSTA